MERNWSLSSACSPVRPSPMPIMVTSRCRLLAPTMPRAFSRYFRAVSYETPVASAALRTSPVVNKAITVRVMAAERPSRQRTCSAAARANASRCAPLPVRALALSMGHSSATIAVVQGDQRGRWSGRMMGGGMSRTTNPRSPYPHARTGMPPKSHRSDSELHHLCSSSHVEAFVQFALAMAVLVFEV